MCDCCKKIIVQTNTTTTGSTTDFISVEDIDLLRNIPYNFNYTAPSDGDYILQLEMYLVLNGEANNDISSQLIKNNIVETNINRNHRFSFNSNLISGYETSYTHNCKITGVVTGDDIGFKLLASSSDIFINNGSITIIKTA